MKPGMQCVLEVLRGYAGCRLVPEPEWELALALAEQQHVLPWFAHQLLQAGIDLPQPVHAALLQAQKEGIRYGFLQSSELKELLRAFAGRHLAVLPLKGPSLARRIYGSSALRISCDLDLLVRKGDFSAARLLLRSLGFTPEARPDDYHQKLRRGATLVELHFDVENPLAIDLDVAGAWRRAYRGDFGGVPAWHFDPDDELLYLCLHAVRHRFGYLGLIVDIDLALERLPLAQRRELHLREIAEVRDAGRFLLLGSAMARRLHPNDQRRDRPTPETLNGNNTKATMERLANELWNDLLTKPAVQQDWRSIHTFFLETEPTTRGKLYRRILHLRILATRLIDADFDFAGRFGLKRTWQVWLLRPARLALQSALRYVFSRYKQHRQPSL